MEEIEVNPRTNLFIRFLQHESNTELFGLFKLWPREYYRHMLPTDSCSLFWAVVWHALRMLPPILKASAGLFIVGYIAISTVTTLILIFTSGFPPRPDFFLRGGVLALMVAAGLVCVLAVSLLAVGWTNLYVYLTDKYDQYRNKERLPTKENPLVVGTLALAGKLYWSVKNRTCVKIKYKWEKE